MFGMALLIVGIINFLYWGNKKEVWFCDEIYTYESANGFEQGWHSIYETVAKEQLEKLPIRKTEPKVGMSLHENYAVFVNYSDEVRDAGVLTGASVQNVYGDPGKIEPFDAAIVRFA